jgi:alpha-amylase
MSSYAFTDNNAGPPANADGSTKTIYINGVPDCFNGRWVCEHRWRDIGNMVGFRNYTYANNFVTNWWSNGNNQIAFGRGERGYIAINREGAALSRTFQTNMPAGTYCDVTKGELAVGSGSCTGPTITVNGAGQFTTSVGAMSAVAIHGGARIGGPAAAVSTSFNETASTVYGQNVYVVGSVPALGSWNTDSAIPLSSATYPVWKATIGLPVNTYVEYKYIKKDANGAVTWESGTNRSFTTPASGSTTRTDTWK